MPHSAQEWANSVQSTPSIEQLRIARDVSKTPPRLFLLNPGQAHLPVPGDPDSRPLNVRTRDHKHFYCLVDGCGPFGTAAGGPEKRDHFRHKTAPTGKNREAHRPESLWHITGKMQLASWLQDCLGTRLTKLEVDAHLVNTPTGDFKPDVYAELETGVRIAIEYQYSPGDTSVLITKRKGYRQAGIVDWWFYSPWPRTCQLRTPAAAGNNSLSANLIAVQQIQLGLGSFYWYNPITETVGTPFCVATTFFEAQPGEWWGEDARQTRTPRRRRPWQSAAWVKLEVDALSHCTVDPDTGKFISPGDQKLDIEDRRTAREISEMRAIARDRDALRALPESPAVDAVPPTERPDPRAPELSVDGAIRAAKDLGAADHEDERIDHEQVVSGERVHPIRPRRRGLWAVLRRLFGR